MNNIQDRKEMVCPYSGADGQMHLCSGGRREDFPKNAAGVPHQCRFWVHILGKNPQTDENINHEDCAIAWNPTLQIEGAQMTRQASAEINEVRKAVHSGNHFLRRAMTAGFRAIQMISGNRVNGKHLKGVEHEKIEGPK